MNEQVQIELKKLLNGRFSTSESARANYARGEDTYDPILSQAVVFPETNEEVSKILKLCNDHKIPVVPFGVIFGVLSIDIGFSPLETMGMSLIVFGCASQIVLLQLFSGFGMFLLPCIKAWEALQPTALILPS